MFPLINLSYDAASPLNILCLGAHSDDIEIGCGGTFLHLARQYPKSVFHWVVFSALRVRAIDFLQLLWFLERHSKNGQNQTLLVQLIRQKERSPETNECGDNSVAGPRW